MNSKLLKSFLIIVLICGLVFTKGAREAEAVCEWTLTRAIAALYEVIARGGSATEIGNVIRQIQKFGSKCDAGGNAITGIPYPTNPLTPYPSPGPGTTYPTPPPSDGSWPFFCQMNPSLQDSYNSLKNHGCGPVSLAMIYCKQRGYDNSSKNSCRVPGDSNTVTGKIAGDLTLLGSYNPSNGIYITNIVKNYIENNLGLLVVPVTTDLATWKEQIDKYGRYIWTTTPSVKCGVGCGSNPNIYFGHAFAVDYVDLANGRFRMRNSNNCTSGIGWEEYTQEPPGKMWYTLADFPAGLGQLSYAIGK